VPASLRFLATQVADIAHHDNQPRGRGQRRRAVFSPARWISARPSAPLRLCRSGADNSAVLAETVNPLCRKG